MPSRDWLSSPRAILIVTGAVALFAVSMVWLFRALDPESEGVNSMSGFQEYLLFTSDLERAVAEIESIGGAVTHRLGDRIFVARLAGGVDPQALAAASPNPPPDLNETEQLLVSAWRSKGTKHDLEKTQRDEKRKWDDPGYESPEYDSPESDG
jgi:hypothetical protein